MEMRSLNPSDLHIKDLHQFIVGAIAPRPIAFASTIDENGIPNLAPYSFFNAFSSNPPILVFSSNRRVQGNTTKDTLHNVQKTGEVVINVVNYDIVKQMTIASVNYAPGVSEFEKAGLTAIPSDTIKAPRVKESPVQFECKVKEIITLGENGGAGHLVICEVQKIHIRESVIDANNRIDPNKLDLVGRLGRAYYVRASGDALFTLFQEPEQMALGFDKLPDSVRKSPYLSGNELASIASLTEFPTAEDVQKVLEEDEELKEILNNNKGHEDMLYRDLHRYAERAIRQDANRLAFCILMVADKYYTLKK
jgi:flavin reductase (DIM6/NTAB) family NADH-FMN oxidoreductase RutF